MRNTSLVLVALGGTALWLAPTFAEDADLQRMACNDVRALDAAVRKHAADMNFYPGPRLQLSPVDVLQEQLGSEYLALVPSLDPWGHPYYYWTDGEHYLLTSAGYEGGIDYIQDQLSADPRGISASLQSLCTSSTASSGGRVLLIDGRFCRLPKDVTHGLVGQSLSEHEKQHISAGDIKVIATALMSYAVDNNAFPVLTDTVTNAEQLRRLLEPIYIRGMPTKDGWDRPYWYWSNGQTFALYSTGQDEEDHPYAQLLDNAKDLTPLDSICAGATNHPGADIVFARDQCCQWPDGFEPCN